MTDELKAEREARMEHIAAEVRKRLSYDPLTGEITWIAPRSSTFIGKPAGRIGKQGYRVIHVQHALLQGHRIAWLLYYGKWPKNDIDHINGIRSDNRISNLRDVPRRVNRENMRKAMPSNKCGYMGVTRSRGSKRWAAKITVKGEIKFLGCFDTPELAHAAYVDAKRKYHEGCAI